ncbi:hypothetical protein BX600DRAFT_472384 [Xylariales sp. PMI_506]|nr:hypothetical protein BX600DRAFT_472384 [Xylariales sp. PMI_506]
MGRLGPLTSQALGRSPYDDAVEGLGEGDPHEPERQYDDKGRVVNDETKRIIKNVIRAHNEVMLVIGVAEPENSSAESLEIALAQKHRDGENALGRLLLSIGRVAGVFGIWGVHGVRQRIMVYQPYSHVEFMKLAHYERTQRSLADILLTGLPSFAGMQAIRSLRFPFNWKQRSLLLQGALEWCQFHFHIYLTMQRLGLISASKWLPDVKFFIPFTAESPIPAPPPIGTLSAASVAAWATQLAANIAPYAAFYLCGHIWNQFLMRVRPHVYGRLPRPSRSEHFPLRPLPQERRSTTPVDNWQTVPESPTLGAADHEIRHGRPADQDIPTLQALEGQAVAPEGSIRTVRRQSTFSSRGGDQDYGTDEEDADMINPTLISFDVDTSESTDQPVGVWSAELRPSFGGEGQPVPPEEPIYMVNQLTSLPSMFAADILTNFVTYTLRAPCDAIAIRGVARAFALRRRLPLTQMYQISLLDGISWRAVGNIVGVEIVKLLISGEIWAFTSIASQYLHQSEDEFKEAQKGLTE